jgi:PhnB protein
MKSFIPYLNFNGNAKDVMSFYAKCLGGELQVMPFGDEAGPENKGRTLHACLTVGGAPVVMASDCPPGMPLTPGNNITINIPCDTLEEIERLFVALGENGKVIMPLGDQFWGARFGMLNDQFGIPWMFNYELPKT